MKALSLWHGEYECSPPRVSFRDMLVAFCALRDVTPAQIIGRDNTKAIYQARQDFMLVMRDTTRASLPRIGQFLGGRDHTTILWGVKQARKRAAA